MRCKRDGAIMEFDWEEDEFWCNTCGYVIKMPKGQEILDFEKK